MPSRHSSRPTSLAVGVQEELRSLTTDIDLLDAIAARRFGINRTDMRCLDVLTAAGPLRASDLAARVNLSTGGLSIALERLERGGYVRRKPHPEDRRSVVVVATDKAHDVDEEIFGAIEQRMRRLLRSYRPAELEIIRRFLSDTRRAIKPPLPQASS